MKGEPFHKPADDARGLPSVYGEAETDALAVGERIFTRCMEFFGDEEQSFVGGLGQRFCRPPGVAGS